MSPADVVGDYSMKTIGYSLLLMIIGLAIKKIVKGLLHLVWEIIDVV